MLSMDIFRMTSRPSSELVLVLFCPISGLLGSLKIKNLIDGDNCIFAGLHEWLDFSGKFVG